jgi:uncharacterized Zn-binding protein involved in type VI secretion
MWLDQRLSLPQRRRAFSCAALLDVAEFAAQEERMRRLQIAFALALCASFAAVSAADDPFTGTWRLNTAKSKYEGGPAPEKATVTIQSDGTTSTVKAESTVDGQSYSTSYTAKLDGTPAPLQGSPVADMMAVKKVDDRTRELKSMKGGKTVSESRATLSADGKTVTVVGSGLNPKGVEVKYTAVYDKQ